MKYPVVPGHSPRALLPSFLTVSPKRKYIFLFQRYAESTLRIQRLGRVLGIPLRSRPCSPLEKVRIRAMARTTGVGFL